MAIITKYELEQEVSTFKLGIDRQYKRAFATSHIKVFLSHSSQDVDLLEDTEALLEKEGASVYVDHKDPAMLHPTNEQTANDIKMRIRENRKFIMLASEKAIKESRWVPWELGYADGVMPHYVAILPVLKESNAWQGSEYLGIYSRIEKIAGSWLVIKPENHAYGKSLKDWLAEK